MTLPKAPNPIKASQIRTELKATTVPWHIGSTVSRKLASKTTGPIKFSDFRGKSFSTVVKAASITIIPSRISGSGTRYGYKPPTTIGGSLPAVGKIVSQPVLHGVKVMSVDINRSKLFSMNMFGIQIRFSGAIPTCTVTKFVFKAGSTTIEVVPKLPKGSVLKSVGALISYTVLDTNDPIASAKMAQLINLLAAKPQLQVEIFGKF